MTDADPALSLALCLVRLRRMIAQNWLFAKQISSGEDNVRSRIDASPRLNTHGRARQSHLPRLMSVLLVAMLSSVLQLSSAAVAAAQETLNVYSIWPENWARPMLQELEAASGIKVNFLRFSSGEALARIIAEKNNPRVDVLFGGPVETFAAGIKEKVLEPEKPPSANALPDRFKTPDGQWTAIA